MKYTGGTWGIATIDGGAAPDEVVTEVNGCLVNIAQVFPACEYSEARPDGVDEPTYTVSKEEAAANASLISAARDLLAALKVGVALESGQLTGVEFKAAVAAWLDQANAAIAKARGEA